MPCQPAEAAVGSTWVAALLAPRLVVRPIHRVSTPHTIDPRFGDSRSAAVQPLTESFSQRQTVVRLASPALPAPENHVVAQPSLSCIPVYTYFIHLSLYYARVCRSTSPTCNSTLRKWSASSLEMKATLWPSNCRS